MTNQEKAEIIIPAQKYIDNQVQYALDTFKAPSFKGVFGSRKRKTDLLLCNFKPLEKLRADISASLELVSYALETQEFSEFEISEKNQTLSIGYEQIGFIMSVELISKIIKNTLVSDVVEKRHLPGGHPVHLISKTHIVDHVKKISALTGNYHTTVDDLQYSNVSEINPHPSCLIGSIGRIALIHHVPERNESGTSLVITPVELLLAIA